MMDPEIKNSYVRYTGKHPDYFTAFINGSRCDRQSIHYTGYPSAYMRPDGVLFRCDTRICGYDNYSGIMETLTGLFKDLNQRIYKYVCALR